MMNEEQVQDKPGGMKKPALPLEFTPERMKQFKDLVAKYEVPASALLPTLYLAQEQFGYLSTEAMDYVGKLLGMPPVQVYEAVTFYVMFKKRDMGKYCLQVCQNISCSILGMDKLLEVAKEELGLSPGQVSEDKLFSLVTVECLGSCDTAPVVQVNEDYVENLNPESFRELLRKMKSQEKVFA